MSKFRQGKIKKQHHIVADIMPLLERLSEYAEVQAVLPGEIHPGSARAAVLRFQYFTETGLKLLARGTSAVQEVFVVSSEPRALQERLEASGLLAAKTAPPAAAAPAPRPTAAPRTVVAVETACAACGRPLRPGARAAVLGTGDQARLLHVHCARTQK